MLCTLVIGWRFFVSWCFIYLHIFTNGVKSTLPKEINPTLAHCKLYRPLRARTAYVHPALPWQNRVTDIYIDYFEIKPITMQGFHWLKIISMLVTLFCHGRSEWTYTVLALRGWYISIKMHVAHICDWLMFVFCLLVLYLPLHLHHLGCNLHCLKNLFYFLYWRSLLSHYVSLHAKQIKKIRIK